MNTVNSGKRISLVIPCLNEAATLDELFSRLDRVVGAIPHITFEMVCVNDGSEDETLDRLAKLQAGRPQLVVVDLSRNFGKEAALSAGISVASGDAVVPIDADLQDPPELLQQMIPLWEQGFEVVLARRSDRSSDSRLKRWTSRAFYKVHNAVSDVHLPENVGDFRLMDRIVVDALKTLPENRRFMKGLFAWIGFRTAVVPYTRASRVGGNSSFNGWQLWNLALEGITSFSLLPLRIWSYVGTLVAVGALGYACWRIIRTFVYGADIPGYESLMVAILFLGGLQMVGIGIIGEYLGRTYLESKRRPPFVIRKVIRQPPRE
jgi:glycosyltransferase involved in cell wall biosynthesis